MRGPSQIYSKQPLNPDFAPLPPKTAGPAAIYYTSSTTGTPKAVIHSHASLAAATQIQIEPGGNFFRRQHAGHVPRLLFDRFWLRNSYHTTVVEPPASCCPISSRAWRSKPSEMNRPTKTYGFPQLYNDLVNYPMLISEALRFLNFCFSAGEAIAVAIQERFKRIFGLEIRRLGDDRTANLLHESAIQQKEDRLYWQTHRRDGSFITG